MLSDMFARRYYKFTFLHLLITINASLGQDSYCKEDSIPYSHVTDHVGRRLCTAQNGTLQILGGISSVVECLNVCGRELRGNCTAYTYYSDSQRCDVFSYPPRNYIRLNNCVNFRSDSFMPYRPPKNPGECVIRIQSFGEYDSPLDPGNSGVTGDATGFIEINGDVAFNVSGHGYSLTTHSPEDGGGQYSYVPDLVWSGIWIAILDFETCSLETPQRFDVYYGSQYTYNMIEWVSTLDPELVIVAVTVGDGYQNVAPAYHLFQPLGGPDLSNSNIFNKWGKFAFIIQVGYPNKTIFPTMTGYGPHLDLNDTTIFGSSLSNVVFQTLLL